MMKFTNSLLFWFLIIFAIFICDSIAKPNKQATKVKGNDPEIQFESGPNGSKMNLDFSMDVKPLSHPNSLFAHFSNRKMVLFYFSAKCIHCQKAFPFVQKFANKMQSKGVTFVAIAVKNNTEDDVRDFIRSYQCSFPVFHDWDRKFSSTYGVSSLPLIIYVNEKGQYHRFKKFDPEKTLAQIESFASN